MKIVRYENQNGQSSYGRSHGDGKVTRVDGDIFGSYRDTGEAVTP
ncbi:MAG: DUF2437 domain-containing protein, partial [Planctomycetes bacterium]|nr:DUF2437 domain-containing protein [Planctomycetota bacterium]